jgi:outer membrane protein assembly factor BamB
LWKLEGLGRGYSTIAIAGGRLLTMGDRDEGSGEAQYALCYGLADRKLQWSTRVGQSHSDGPRCTPTVDGELTYVIGTDGDLLCLETATGRIRWQKNLPKEFGGRMMSVWKFSESPLVDGDHVVCTPGGPTATVVALQKKTGDVVWRCAVPELGRRGKDGAAYSSMIVADIDGVRQYVQVLGRGAVGVAADDGRFLWGYNKIANTTANIPTPIVRDNYVFVTTSYKTGSALLLLTRAGQRMKVDEVWFHGPDEFENHHGGVVLVGDHLYGGDGQNGGTPVCLDFLTGKILWKAEAPGKRSAAVLYADGNLVFRYESGLTALIEADPREFRVKGQFQEPVKSGPAWPYPVIHDGRLYLRAADTLMCFDVRAASGS